MSPPEPSIIPLSFKTDRRPVVLSLASDLKKLDEDTPPNASESVAVPLNLALATVLESWIPCATFAKPAAVKATALVSVVLGVKARLEITPTTVSCVTSFKIDLNTPVLSCTVSVTTCVTPDPAIVVGPINVHTEPV